MSTLTLMAQWFLFVYLNLCAGSIALLWVWQDESRRRGLVDFLACWATLFLATIIVAETGLGLIRMLTPLGLAVALSGGAAVSWLIFVRRGCVLSLPPRWRDAWRTAWLALLDGRVSAIIVFVPWLFASLTISALAEPSGLFDTFVYHLPMPVDWLQHGAFTPTYIPMAEVANSYFPGNAELFYFWMLAPFRNDLLVRLIPVGMWVLLGLGLWWLCRQAGVTRTAASIAVLIFLFTPLVLSQATELWTDGMAAALFVLALGHVFEYARRPRGSTAALFGLAGGLFLGVKYSGPSFLILLLGVFVAIALAQSRFHPRATFWRSCIVALLAVIATGGYWYLRNLILAGNPFYPFGLSVAGREIFAGPGPSFGDKIWDSLGRFCLGDAVSAAISGYGLFFWLAAGIAALATVRPFSAAHDSLSSARPRLRRGPLVAIAGLALASFLIYLNTPYSVMRFSASTPITSLTLAQGMRFSLVGGACVTILIAAGLSHLPRRLNPAWPVAVLALAEGCLAGYDIDAFGFFPSRLFTLPRLLAAGGLIAIAIVLARASIGMAWRRMIGWRAWRSRVLWLGLTAAALTVAGFGLASVERYREEFRDSVYEQENGEIVTGWRWVADHVSHARVAYVGTRSYALYGRDLSNEVRYINTVGDLADRYDDFYRGGTTYRANSSYETWMRNLAAWSPQYFVVTFEGPTPEDTWAFEHPKTFRLAFSNNMIHVYQVIMPRAPD